MHISRRNLVIGSAALFGIAGMPKSQAATDRLPEPVKGDNGLYTQPWFHQSFLDLREDLKEAVEAGKSLAIIWEQNGCPYCREMHRVNLRIPEVVNYIKNNYLVLQLDLYGAREVTDFDGKTMEERALARRWRVNFTPTLSFFTKDVLVEEGKSGAEIEAWRLTGYWKPFHFRSTFVYVHTGGYKTEPRFQRWLSEYADRLRAEGKKVELW